MIFPLYTEDGIHPQEDNYKSPIYNTYDNFRPIFIFTDKYYNSVDNSKVPKYNLIKNKKTIIPYPENCNFFNKLPNNTNNIKFGYNFIDAIHYNKGTDPINSCERPNNNNGYFYYKTNPSLSTLGYINTNINEIDFNYRFINSLGTVFLNLDILKVSVQAFNPLSPIRIGIKVINLDDLRITNHRYPYDYTISAIKIPPFNVTGTIGAQTISSIQRMNIDVQYSDPVNIDFKTNSNKLIIYDVIYSFNNYKIPDANSTLTLYSVAIGNFYIKQGVTKYYLNKLSIHSLNNNTYYNIYIEIDNIEKQLSSFYTDEEKEIYQSFILPKYYFDKNSFNFIIKSRYIVYIKWTIHRYYFYKFQ